MASINLWTRDELILALNLYLKLPFYKISGRNPEVIHLAKLINRSANSVSIRLSNFASCDPYHQARGVKGLEGGKKQCQPIWDEFLNNRDLLIFESESLLAEREKRSIEEKFNSILEDTKNLYGEDRIQEVKTRVNQNFFRQLVLANYESTCAISGINIPDLLVSSHIIPWSKNTKERLNPENGICLSSLYDKAFDKGLIGIKENLEIVLSKDLKRHSQSGFYQNFFASIENTKIKTPQKYLPGKDFIQFHLDEIFAKRNGQLFSGQEYG
jgi:putative restriction endonuclease